MHRRARVADQEGNDQRDDAAYEQTSLDEIDARERIRERAREEEYGASERDWNRDFRKALALIDVEK